MAHAADDDEVVLLASDSSLLHFPASAVRPQGRAAGGMAGIKLGPACRVVFAGSVSTTFPAQVVTVAGTSSALPGTQTGTAKVTSFDAYPGKGTPSADQHDPFPPVRGGQQLVARSRSGSWPGMGRCVGAATYGRARPHRV